MTISKVTNILIAGVGGQGNRTLMKIIASAALAGAIEVRVLSTASLGKLGGPITCHIRFGPSTSASIPVGETDILVALEMNEALRAMPMMRPGALAFIHMYRRIPITANIQGMHYPSIQEIEKIGAAKTTKCIFVPDAPLSQEKRSIGFVNTAMLGTFCGYTRILPRSSVEQSLFQHLPSHSTLPNLQAFDVGWQYGQREAMR